LFKNALSFAQDNTQRNFGVAVIIHHIKISIYEGGNA